MFESRNGSFAPALAAALAGIALAGCHASSEGPESPPPPVEQAIAKFNLATGSLPYPIDLYFAPSAAAPLPDGTLNLPTVPWRNAAMQGALNSQDGWSTTASLDTGFTLPLDSASIGASSVKIIKLWLNPSTKAPATNPNFLPANATSPVAGVLTYGTDFTADVSPDVDSGGKILRITPLKPFDFSRGPAVNIAGPDAGKILNVGYLVVLTNGLKATTGEAMGPDTFYANIKAAPADCSTFADATQKQVCQLFKAHLGIAQATGTNPADVVLSWSFSTQSIDDTLNVISLTAAPQQTLIVPTGLTTQMANASLQGKANIYVGSTRLPYYLTPAATPSDKAVLTSFWTAAAAPNPALGLDPASRNLTMFNPTPAKVTDVTVPLLVTIPNSTSACPFVYPASAPPGGWPVAIVQHGITRNRSDALAMSDGFADACFIVASIDLPLHGITDTTNPLYCDATKPQCIGATERTFNVDLVNNATGAAVPDTVIDASGTHMINLTSPRTGRDNLRQAEADLIVLTKSIQTLTIAPGTPLPAGPVGVNPARVSFAGQSLGAIVGGSHVHFANDLATVTLEEPGGVLTKLLLDSATFGPRISGGVAATAVRDSYSYNLFFRDFQAVIDSADPINHIKDAVTMHPVHLIKVLNDAVVPNNSTDRLIAAGGLNKLKTLGPNAVGPGNGGYAFFKLGAHGSMFSPTPSLAATIEMQSQAIKFAATAVAPGGPFVFLTDPTVLDLN
jgi:Bacterial virulence factor lipase N-terminal